ncbi:MAG TPA: hypothetical protein PKE26_13370 [Kiritimatiellia bacterium]|nr:hypothetical protein [Kiritimatiellia bacterium]HMP00091.1 hypothetical protein [Kiritimatiellia bacterium]HMP96632.1 hypothetical protein [Kiritimatiellia bacterium]
MNETFAQALFWLSMGCLPAGLIGLTYGIQNRNKRKGKFFVFGSALGLSHFTWYFRTLGFALADKTGGFEYPTWWLHILVGAAAGLVLAILTSHQNKAEPDDAGQRR